MVEDEGPPCQPLPQALVCNPESGVLLNRLLKTLPLAGTGNSPTVTRRGHEKDRRTEPSPTVNPHSRPQPCSAEDQPAPGRTPSGVSITSSLPRCAKSTKHEQDSQHSHQYPVAGVSETTTNTDLHTVAYPSTVPSIHT